MIPADTSAEAHRLQTRIYRDMGGAGRLAVAFELSDMTRRLTEAGIRRRHPDYSDEQVLLARARITLGDTLTRAAWPDRPLVEP